MDDLISRKALIDYIKNWDIGYGVGHDQKTFINAIEEQPTVKAKSVVHGEWIKESMGMRKNINTGEFIEAFYCTCPVCGYRTGNQGTRFNFCPKCGADMRKKVQE